ncbi:hypothetical protein MRX96_003705 [Rhipicephalus microplus]
MPRGSACGAHVSARGFRSEKRSAIPAFLSYTLLQRRLLGSRGRHLNGPCIARLRGDQRRRTRPPPNRDPLLVGTPATPLFFFTGVHTRGEGFRPPSSLYCILFRFKKSRRWTVVESANYAVAVEGDLCGQRVPSSTLGWSSIVKESSCHS